MQFPEALRVQDANLRYQPTHRLHAGNQSLGIGPRSVAFAVAKPYPGWIQWSSFFRSVLDLILSTSAIAHTERVGLRYINLFSGRILERLNLQISVTGTRLTGEPTNLRTEIQGSGITRVLQVANSAGVTVNGKAIRASVVDIDCVLNIEEDGESFGEVYWDIVTNAHEKEKTLFFSLLTDEFVNSLNPAY